MVKKYTSGNSNNVYMYKGKEIDIKSVNGTIEKYEVVQIFSIGKKNYSILQSNNNGKTDVMRCHFWNQEIEVEPIESNREKNRAMLFYKANFAKGFKPTDEELQIMYKIVKSDDFPTRYYSHKNIGDDMELMLENISGWWKPRFLLDNRNKTACVFMNRYEYLRTITVKDINMNSLKGVDEHTKNRAKNLYAGFPVIIGNFIDDTARVEWQLKPDGLYYIDDEGYGRTNDIKIALIGRINRKGKAKGKFICY